MKTFLWTPKLSLERKGNIERVIWSRAVTSLLKINFLIKFKPENQINVEELKQTFQQMIDEIKNENTKQNSVLKEIIEQKNEKIICLENKVKQVIN